MATVTLPDFDVTQNYQNIVTTLPAAGSVDVEIQNIGLVPIAIVARASGGVPANTTGLILQPGEGFNFNAAQLWVKTLGGVGRVSLTTTG